MDCEVSRFAVCVPFREPFRGLCSVSFDKRFFEGYFCIVFTRGLGGGKARKGLEAVKRGGLRVDG